MSNLLPDASRSEQALYVVCRGVHFVVMAITLPVAWLTLHGAASPAALPVWLGPVAWIGAAIWALLHFGLHSFSFPTNAAGALFTTASPLVNLAVAGSESFGDGALAVVQASLLASCLALVGLLVVVRVPELRQRVLPQAPASASRLLAALLPPMLLVAWGFGAFAFRGQWVGDGWNIVVGLGFLNQVYSELQVLWAGSVFGDGGRPAAERSRLHQAWAPLLIVCMMGSLLAFAIVALCNA